MNSASPAWLPRARPTANARVRSRGARAPARGTAGGGAGRHLACTRAVADPAGRRAARGRTGRARRRPPPRRADPRARDREGGRVGTGVPGPVARAHARTRREKGRSRSHDRALDREWKDERITEVLAARAAAPKPLAPFELDLRGGGRITSDSLRRAVRLPADFPLRYRGNAIRQIIPEHYLPVGRCPNSTRARPDRRDTEPHGVIRPR